MGPYPGVPSRRPEGCSRGSRASKKATKSRTATAMAKVIIRPRYKLACTMNCVRPERYVNLAGQHRQDHGVQHDRYHHAAEQVAAVPVHRCCQSLA
jgi:hypothetical protein